MPPFDPEEAAQAARERDEAKVALQAVAATLGVPADEVQYELGVLKGIAAQWEEACALARAHLSEEVPLGKSLFDAIPKLAEAKRERDELRVYVNELEARVQGNGKLLTSIGMIVGWQVGLVEAVKALKEERDVLRLRLEDAEESAGYLRETLTWANEAADKSRHEGWLAAQEAAVKALAAGCASCMGLVPCLACEGQIKRVRALRYPSKG